MTTASPEPRKCEQHGIEMVGDSDFPGIGVCPMCVKYGLDELMVEIKESTRFKKEKEAVEVFSRAAELWDELGFPPFLIEGHWDGHTQRWHVPAFLSMAAGRLRAMIGKGAEDVEETDGD